MTAKLCQAKASH